MLKTLGRAKNLLVRKLFPYFEKYLGIHITPVHYFSPIPTTYELPPAVYTGLIPSGSLNWNGAGQLETLKRISAYAHEFIPQENTGLSLLDSFLLYTMIRENHPRRMVEIGSGATTEIALQALRKNRSEGHPFHFVAIEPFPSARLRTLEDPDFELMVKKVQDVEVKFFSDVDLLFIDSTHVSRIGSDVNYEIFEILPALPKGALIHWHDIPLPQNYWQDWIQSGNQFWNEAYLLQAFLMFNRDFSIIWASNFLSLKYLNELKKQFAFLRDDHRNSSFWVRRLL
jgi:hypothetical protein